jgi:phenylacetic acid degradation operon negative regulatory protein
MNTQRPQDLVFNLFGEYLRQRGSPVWVGSLIALLKPFGVTEGGVRTVLSRMARKGWLSTRRVGRHSYYDLTAKGRRLLEEGEARIFHPSWDSRWDGLWLLVAYSIPEVRRHLRDRLRTRLAWFGFGPLGNGLWISPHDVEERVAELAEELGIAGHLDCFRGRHLDRDDVELVSRCWDLPALDCLYKRFIERWKPELERCTDEEARERLSDAHLFALRFLLISEFREFTLLDPYLPRELLPCAWEGDRAASLFNEVHDLLEGPAERYVDDVLDAEPGGRPRREQAHVS